MKLIKSSGTQARFNLALEETLFNDVSEDYLLIYVNENTVVVGKHQNAIAEINAAYLHEEGIPVFRRFSGGGTVFHDVGNINFSFITTGEVSRLIDFKKYALPVVEFLNVLGVKASLTERNDIFVAEKKVSGHAAHAKGNRSLHHGTLLFNSDLKKLGKGLSGEEGKFVSRGVKSVRSSVTNILDHMDEKMNQKVFIGKLVEHLKHAFNISEELSFKEGKMGGMEDAKIREIEELINSKYSSDDWNYGYSPDYSFEVNELDWHFKAYVVKGRFDKFEFQRSNKTEELVKGLVGQFHTYHVVWNYLKNFQPTAFNLQQLVNSFFATNTQRH